MLKVAPTSNASPITTSTLPTSVSSSIYNQIYANLTSLWKWKLALYDRKLQTSSTQEAEWKTLQTTNNEQKKPLSLHQLKRQHTDLYIGHLLHQRFTWIRSKLTSLIDKSTVQTIFDTIADITTNPSKGIPSVSGDSRSFIRKMMMDRILSLQNGYQQFTNMYSNVLLLGDAGSGKTGLARMMAYAWSRLGVLVDDQVLEITTSSFIGLNLVDTNIRTQELLVSAVERILFFDEAYEIGCVPKGDPRSFVMTEIIKWMDTYAGLSIVIAAGYESEMKQCFLTANAGVPRRFIDQIRLPRYSVPDLVFIFNKQVSQRMPFEKSIFSPLELQYLGKVFAWMDSSETTTCCGQDLLAFQAGDITNMATLFVREYYAATTGHKWINGDVDNNRPIIDNATRQFIQLKLGLNGMKAVQCPSSFRVHTEQKLHRSHTDFKLVLSTSSYKQVLRIRFYTNDAKQDNKDTNRKVYKCRLSWMQQKKKSTKSKSSHQHRYSLMLQPDSMLVRQFTSLTRIHKQLTTSKQQFLSTDNTTITVDRTHKDDNKRIPFQFKFICKHNGAKRSPILCFDINDLNDTDTQMSWGQLFYLFAMCRDRFRFLFE
jgi:hypothetical protein